MEDPVVHNFSVANPGIHPDTKGFEPIDFCQLFITDELLDNNFVTETNKYAADWRAAHGWKLT